MDNDAFDRIALRIAEGGSRRSILITALGSGLLATMTTADAAGRHKRKPKHCKPKCAHKECGKDGCRGSCGTCTPPEKCVNGKCACITECDGSHCGPDGCGGTCACPDSDYCEQAACLPCNPSCPSGQRCIQGTCTCDPFNNACPNDADGQCACGAIVPVGGDTFTAACADRNSACDLTKPCTSNADCATGTVCLLGCRDATDPDGPRRCSNPCVPI